MLKSTKTTTTSDLQPVLYKILKDLNVLKIKYTEGLNYLDQMFDYVVQNIHVSDEQCMTGDLGSDIASQLPIDNSSNASLDIVKSEIKTFETDKTGNDDIAPSAMDVESYMLLGLESDQIQNDSGGNTTMSYSKHEEDYNHDCQASEEKDKLKTNCASVSHSKVDNLPKKRSKRKSKMSMKELQDYNNSLSIASVRSLEAESEQIFVKQDLLEGPPNKLKHKDARPKKRIFRKIHDMQDLEDFNTKMNVSETFFESIMEKINEDNLISMLDYFFLGLCSLSKLN